jgi:hypothetical protein
MYGQASLIKRNTPEYSDLALGQYLNKQMDFNFPSAAVTTLPGVVELEQLARC